MAKKTAENNQPQTLEEALVIIEKLEAEKAQAFDIIADQKKQLASATKKAEAKDCIIEHGGVKYKVTAKKFHFNGSLHTSDELSENDDLVSDLVKIGAGFLVKIEE